MEDLRDLGGRLRRVLVSVIVGAVGSGALGWVFPVPEPMPLLHSCMGRAGSQLVMEDSFLLIAGAIALAVACYAVLSWRARRPHLPRARVVH